MSVLAEVHYERGGTYVKKHDTFAEAVVWIAGRKSVQTPTNPVRGHNIKDAVVVQMRPEGEMDCPKCGDPVSAAVGIHFDCVT